MRRDVWPDLQHREWTESEQDTTLPRFSVATELGQRSQGPLCTDLDSVMRTSIRSEATLLSFSIEESQRSPQTVTSFCDELRNVPKTTSTSGDVTPKRRSGVL